MQTGGGGVGEGAVWGDFLFEGEELLFLYLVVEQADVGVLQGGFETEDDVGFGCLGGDEGDDVQTDFQQVVDDGSADAIDFHDYQVEEPIAVDLGDAGFQLGVVDAVEAGEVHLFFGVEVQDGNDGVVAGGGDVHGGDVVMVYSRKLLFSALPTGWFPIAWGLDPPCARAPLFEGGDGFYIAEDGAVFLNELGKVFLTEDFIGGGTAGKVNLRGVDVGVGGGGELPGAPGLGVDEGLVEEVIEPVAAVGGADEEGGAFFIGKGGAEDFGPDFGLLEGTFIEDDKVQTFPTEVIEDF